MLKYLNKLNIIILTLIVLSFCLAASDYANSAHGYTTVSQGQVLGKALAALNSGFVGQYADDYLCNRPQTMPTAFDNARFSSIDIWSQSVTNSPASNYIILKDTASNSLHEVMKDFLRAKTKEYLETENQGNSQDNSKVFAICNNAINSWNFKELQSKENYVSAKLLNNQEFANLSSIDKRKILTCLNNSLQALSNFNQDLTMLGINELNDISGKYPATNRLIEFSNNQKKGGYTNNQIAQAIREATAGFRLGINSNFNTLQDEVSKVSKRDLKLHITGVDSSRFPAVSTYVTITDGLNRPVDNNDIKFHISDGNKSPLISKTYKFGNPNINNTSHIVLVMDQSGSMQGNPMMEAKTAAKRFVSASQLGEWFSLIVFSDNSKTIVERTRIKELMAMAVQRASANGDTALYDALLGACKLLEKEQGRKIILVLSDGANNAGKTTLEQVKKTADEKGISIFAIALGDKTEHKNLASLADGTGGRCYYTMDAAALSGIYGDVNALLRNSYKIDYLSADQSDTYRNLRIQALIDGINIENTVGHYPQSTHRQYIPDTRVGWSQNDKSKALFIDVAKATGKSGYYLFRFFANTYYISDDEFLKLNTEQIVNLNKQREAYSKYLSFAYGVDSQALLDAVHTGLDILGMVPVLGFVGDSSNAVLYLIEGKVFDASISGASLLPFGDIVKGAKYLWNPATKHLVKVTEDIKIAHVYEEARVVAKGKKSAEEAMEVSVLDNTEKIAGSDIRHLNGALAETHGYNKALAEGEIGIQSPEKITATGPDYITYNPKTQTITVWDSKYSLNQNWPNSAKGFESEKWINETKNAIDNIQDSDLREQVKDAFKNGKIKWQLFKWPK
ncbi:VWA domain-containing protein [Sporomusa aerivorans]|uniref:VWA domain-containing protein n=1 Tax=Sporomusa aerivorans TaxID=204936 RepID=UPI00352A7ED8